MSQVRPGGAQRGSVSRRAFILGVIAAGSIAAAGGYALRRGRRRRPAAGAVERLISLKVNGQVRRVDVLPQETLSTTLRYRLALTGTKLGCDRAECGNCTVLVDGEAHYACSRLTHSMRGHEITTIEGLARENGELHSVQQAFVDELGPQCGFCTPGQIMTTVAFLKVNPSPTREEARQALSGNLCRCGAYEYYLNSVMRAAGSV